ncbi:hypothetical protein L2E82_41459 [Cichorium intybus]|uniref:Uncharacterized protein n=1 Tax=Cichorium intybus TaxID=13427 RepID=A0ACB9APH7_CICIN|nr:hypothetical protein L2E82_41459 [Cichorium intybus]
MKSLHRKDGEMVRAKREGHSNNWYDVSKYWDDCSSSIKSYGKSGRLAVWEIMGSWGIVSKIPSRHQEWFQINLRPSFPGLSSSSVEGNLGVEGVNVERHRRGR